MKGRTVKRFLVPEWRRLLLFAVLVGIMVGGKVQAWAFSDLPPKPLLYDLLRPLPIWPLWMLLLAPLALVSWSLRLVGLDLMGGPAWLFIAANLVYFYLLSGAVVVGLDWVKARWASSRVLQGDLLRVEEGTLKGSGVAMSRAEVFERALGGELGGARAREMVRQAGIRYGELMTEREHYSDRALCKHLEENILPGVALYQTLLADEDTRDRAEPLVELAFREWAMSGRRSMERLGRLPVFYWLLRALIRPMMRLNFPAPGWETEWVEVSGQALAFNMKSCFYLDVLEGYGVPELTKYYCTMDDLVYEGASPYVRWARAKTLGRGDECCDFRFERVRRPQ